MNKKSIQTFKIFLLWPVKTKNTLSLSRTTLPSTDCPGLPSAVTRPLGKPTSRANQGRNIKIPPPNDADSHFRPRYRTAGAGPDERDHRVWSELCTHCSTDSLPCHAPPGTDKDMFELRRDCLRQSMGRLRLRQYNMTWRKFSKGQSLLYGSINTTNVPF